jgi:hypothetical protein
MITIIDLFYEFDLTVNWCESSTDEKAMQDGQSNCVAYDLG